MTNTDYKIYCDESCHLQSDESNVMVLGALRCTAPEVEKNVRAIKELRRRHNYHTELKWTRLIGSQLDFYLALVDLFFDVNELKFKATVVRNKERLNHDRFNDGSHGTFYYKMAFYTLRDMMIQQRSHRIYLDYMDTQSGTRSKKLADVLKNNFQNNLFVETYIIRSYESQLIQLCDFLIGAISYTNRTDIPHTGKIKRQIVQHLEKKLSRSLTEATPPWEEKFNIFMFSPKVV